MSEHLKDLDRSGKSAIAKWTIGLAAGALMLGGAVIYGAGAAAQTAAETLAEPAGAAVPPR